MPPRSKLTFTTDKQKLAACNTFIVTVPTPVGKNNRPVLTPLKGASETVGSVLKRGDVVVYESTVYPGCTEEYCVPILEEQSGLKFNKDFFAGYSPERINPGDKQHRLPTIKKVTSGSTPEIAEYVDQLYGSIITAGTHKASSLKVAEAAKVIENTQRDINIALINELALIFNRLGIDTEEVLKAAGTKWNFLNFRPGPRRRALHRRGPVLPDAQGRRGRLSPRDDSRGPPAERQHGRARGDAHDQADDRSQHPAVGRARAGARAHVQGELPRRAQHESRRRDSRAAELRLQGRRARSVGESGRSGARVWDLTDGRAQARQLRCVSSSPWRTSSSWSLGRRGFARSAARTP